MGSVLDLFGKITLDTTEYDRGLENAKSKVSGVGGAIKNGLGFIAGTVTKGVGATTGGITFNSNPSYSDFGEDVDNCPNNMLELKHLDGYDPTMSGTFLTCTPAVIKNLVATGDISTSDATRVIPRNELLRTDFKDIWWIGDYSDVNTGTNAGFLAIHLMNALNQAGFQITSGKNSKGQMAFEYHGHYSMAAQELVPFEIYCKDSGAPETYYVLLDKHNLNLVVGDTAQLGTTTNPAGKTVQWSSSAQAKATVSATGEVTAVAAGSTTITATISENSVNYTDTCTVIVTAE